MSELDFTGERLVPGVYGKIAVEHLHRYAICLDFVKGKNVLDIASGEGYGSNLLSKFAQEVVGVDISQNAVDHAKRKYLNKNLIFKVGSVLDIPCESEVFDIVVSFETIEHISDHQKMIAEIKRVIKPDGVLIISTPEKSVYSDRSNYSNPFHEKELYEEEFIQILKEKFQFIDLGYQRFMHSSFIWANDGFGNKLRVYNGDFLKIDQVSALIPEYIIAVCSNTYKDSPKISSIFQGDDFEKLDVDNFIKLRMKKFKSGLRYRLINFIFFPIDQLRKLKFIFK